MAQVEISQTDPLPTPARARHDEPSDVELSTLRAYFKSDLKMDQSVWNRLIEWLEEQGLKARYERAAFPHRLFELTLSGCDEDQIEEFVIAFEPERHFIVP